MAKLILTNEVQGLGAAGDVVDVKNGYARNFLFPRASLSRGATAAKSRSSRLKMLVWLRFRPAPRMLLL